jgi:Zn-finger nucleic acid-binding protein
MTRCPLCDCEMREVSARANPGTLIVLDQCSKCGGIWCDKWELFPIDPEEAKRLDPLDEQLLRAPVALEKKELYCPRCTDRLQLFRDPLLPPDIQLQRCRRCEGIWLNRGRFGRYKRLQQKTRMEKLPQEERVQRLARAYQDPRSWVTTGTRGIFAYPRGEEEGSDWNAPTLGGAVKLILQALLRLILNF